MAIVSESVARRYWPGQDAVGKRLRFTSADRWPWVTVVGVAADARYRELTRSWMTVYFPARQFFFFQAASLVVRGTAGPQALAPVILQRMQAIEPATSLGSATSMDALLARELARPLTAMSVASVFAALALDPAAFAGAAGLLVAVVLSASFFPARHAARTDPATILRTE